LTFLFLGSNPGLTEVGVENSPMVYPLEIGEISVEGGSGVECD
jgi:hypothetical protein